MDDVIYRQDAIDKLRSNLTYMQVFGVDRSITLIDEVPSAAVRCADCYHYNEEHGQCLLNESRFEPNDFCSYWSE